MARVPTKRIVVIGIMTAHADKPMNEVVPMIQNHPEVACSANQAKAWYKWIVDRDMAPGKVISLRTNKEKAPAEPTVDYKTVAAEAAAEILDPVSEEDELAARQANLEKIKAAAEGHVDA
jgi:hypothetical protein